MRGFLTAALVALAGLASSAQAARYVEYEVTTRVVHPVSDYTCGCVVGVAADVKVATFVVDTFTTPTGLREYSPIWGIWGLSANDDKFTFYRENGFYKWSANISFSPGTFDSFVGGLGTGDIVSSSSIDTYGYHSGYVYPTGNVVGFRALSYDETPRALGFVSFTASSVQWALPEPSSWAMMIIGFGLIGGASRSRPRSHPAAGSA